VKIGLSPVQRKDFDYEFDIVFDLLSDRSHRFMCSKDRTTIKITPIEGNNFTCYTESLFGDSEIPILLDDTVGKKITFWLENGAEIAEAKKETPKTEIQKNIEIKARELYKEINNPTVKFEEAKNRWNEFISIDSIENIGEEIQSAFNKLLNKKEINEMPSASQKFDNEPAQAVNY
jgi:hypothetical protein